MSEPILTSGLKSIELLRFNRPTFLMASNSYLR